MGIALLIVLLVLLLITLPRASRRGYGTPAILGLAAIVLVVAMAAGYIPWTGWNWAPAP
jgi:hypothetical protein